MDRPKEFGKVALAPEFKEGVDLIWKRDQDGFKTNVRWQVRHHSPSGLEIGYPGSGPADLALNVMATLLPVAGGGRTERCFDGRVSSIAWLFHQAFKFRFLSSVDPQEGRIEWSKIDQWLEEKRVKFASD
jgi:hypothetical protein